MTGKDMASQKTLPRDRDASGPEKGYIPARFLRRSNSAEGERREASAAGYEAIGLQAQSVDEVIATIKQEGLPTASFDRLQERLGLSAGELASIVQVAERTLRRRRKQGHFRSDESERILRIARLFDRAVEVLGSEARAQKWLKTPLPVLAEKTPLAYADTEPGAREVEDVLGRIAYGVFS